MEGTQKEEGLHQWHPAFFADIQIELKDDADNLIFESEHQLSKKPMEIDVLVIKKEKEKPVRKSGGYIKISGRQRISVQTFKRILSVEIIFLKGRGFYWSKFDGL